MGYDPTDGEGFVDFVTLTFDLPTVQVFLSGI